MIDLLSKLIRAGLCEEEAELFQFIFNNSGCSVADACSRLQCSKSSLYRSFHKLQEKGLVEVDHQNWRQSLQITSLDKIIHQLEKRKRRDEHLIRSLKCIEIGKKMNINPKTDFVESLNEQETYEKYLDLSEMNWDSVLAFGNWEDLNHDKRNMIPIEKKFVRNRVKRGAKAFVSVTKEGPYTTEIIDYRYLDEKENRKSKKSNMPFYRPFWISAFEGNDYVHLWNMDGKKNLVSTLIHSRVIADFYRDFIYSSVS